ncbi:Triokinase/FMN cyclase [Nymphon striatum]|nr:Triokinase/FMN cyclase [Nymphon striatum]
MNKLINNVASCVDESIEGFLCLHHNAVSVIKEHRIVIRKDILDVKKKGQVTLLSGGGSGHEPAHIGFVGQGMLSAAVCGNVFSSPPVSSILSAIRAIGKYNKGGCLLIVKNYTGDRLNFKLAMSKAQLEGILVKMVIIGEDCALISPDKSIGRRGLCGTLLIHKISGAMAESGKSLDEIVDYVEKILPNLGTIGVSLSSCIPPGSSETFKLDEDHMELGLGIHGEPGVSRLKSTYNVNLNTFKLLSINRLRDGTQIVHTRNENNQERLEELPDSENPGFSHMRIVIDGPDIDTFDPSRSIMPARDIISLMFKQMTNEDSGYNIKFDGAAVILVINNLGGLSELEMGIVAKECLDYLDKFGTNVARVYSGKLMTSLDMRGVSVTVLHASSHTLNYLDQTTKAPAWLKSFRPIPPASIDHTYLLFEEELQEDIISEGMKMSPELTTFFVKAVNSVCSAIKNSEKMLNDLDCRGGDGDCGHTLAQGSLTIEKLIQQSKQDDFCQPHRTFMKFGQNIENSMGGTSGALYNIFFTSAATAFCDPKKKFEVRVWVNALKYGLKAIMEAGGAQPGDRTMVDALHAAVETLDSVPIDGTVDTKLIMDQVIENINKAVMKTKNMKAKAGRASYVSEDRTNGHCDAGAMAIFIIFKAIQIII